MKIIHVASGDLWAGAEVQLFHLATALNSLNNVSITVFLLNHGQLEMQLIDKGVAVKVFDERTHSTLEIFQKIKTSAKELQVDIIHSHREKENVLSSLVAYLIGCSSIRTVHGDSEADNTELDFRRYLINLINRTCGNYLQKKIVSVSGELTSKLKKQFDSKKLVTINNSVNVDYIHKRSLEKIDEVIEMDKRINIGFVGRFVPVKRVDLFLDIARRVISLNPKMDIHFYMIGDGPLFDEISTEVEIDRLTNKIHLTGFVENSAPYIKQLSYLMFTSEHEGLPMTLLEAMALQVPVISTDLPSIKSVLSGKNGGYFLDSADPNELAMFIIDIVKRTEESISKSKFSKNVLLEEYSLSTNINKYVELYKEVLS